MKVVRSWHRDCFVIEFTSDEMQVFYPGTHRIEVPVSEMYRSGWLPQGLDQNAEPEVRDGVNVVFEPDGIIRKADDSKPASFNIRQCAVPVTISAGDLERAAKMSMHEILGVCDCGAQKSGTLPHSSWCSKEKANAGGQ
jgi:hypothetical protein